MSADRWSICPRCLDRACLAQKQKLDEAAAAYGNVPAEEYERLVAEARVAPDPEDFRTFREDYEFYIVEEGGVYKVCASYRGGCDTCGLTATFEPEPIAFYDTERDG